MAKDKTKHILTVSPAAQRDLKKLPVNIAKEIVFKHLPEIQNDPYGLAKPLVGGLRGEWSYAFGKRPEYRIIYFIRDKEIVITLIGSRENIYKSAKRRK